jgi:hypothetical protein
MKIINNYRLTIFLVITFCMIFCKKSENSIVKNNQDLITQNDSVIEKKDTVSDKKEELIKNSIQDFQGTWYCYKFTKDERFNEGFDDKYANEFSNFSNFIIKKDSLLLKNRCKSLIYIYKYPIKLKKFEDESTFITFFKPQKDSLSFITSMNTSSIQCEAPFKTLCILDNDLLIHDRGYFFHFYKQNKNPRNNSFNVIGIPGDNRNEWIVTKTYTTKNINEVYKDFKNNFTFSSSKLRDVLPNNNFHDEQNDVDYKKDKDSFIIIKNDPMGVITISFKTKDGKILLEYKMEYLGEG